MSRMVRILAIAGFGWFATSASAEDQIIRLAECEGLNVEQLHELAVYALNNRRYSIEEDTPTLLVGEQDDLKVEIAIDQTTVTIRWKEGFGHSRDQWLRNLKTDILWRLAE